jgi:hypothetical protein
MHLHPNPKLKFPKRAMAKAGKICRDFSLFAKAEDALQSAVDAKNARSEMYWRNVFGAFARLVFRRQRWTKESPWHLANTAALYAYGGDNPRYESDEEQERTTEGYHRLRRQEGNGIPVEIDRHKEDGDIPF